MWLTVGLTAAYVLFFAVTLPEDSPSIVAALLFWEGVFAGPMIIAAALSVVINRIEARTTFLTFAAGYSILTAFTFYWTFAFEYDAQYQLMLFLIPLLGFPTVAVLGLAVVFGLAAEKVR